MHFDTNIAQVTLALCLTGGMPVLRGLMVFPAQLVAGIAAAGVVSALFPGPLNCATRLGGGASISQGLFIEMFLTAQLVLVIIMLAVVKHKSTYLAPVGIGLAFFVCELIGTPTPFPPSFPILHPLNRNLTISNRRLLYRRLPQPRPLPWSGRYQPQFPRIPLDLLGWTVARLAPGLGLLSPAVLRPLGAY